MLYPTELHALNNLRTIRIPSYQFCYKPFREYLQNLITEQFAGDETNLPWCGVGEAAIDGEGGAGGGSLAGGEEHHRPSHVCGRYPRLQQVPDRKSTRLNSSHPSISYA